MPPVKLKSQPDDFQVDELSDFPLENGPFAVYRLTKESLGTPEAITAILQRWNLSRSQISYGGLKDRHAVTQQWVTIHRGPRQDLEQNKFLLAYQGQAQRPFTPQDIAGNRFRIVLRDLSLERAAAIAENAGSVVRDGIPNYFDDQRFGSLGESGEFIARPWCQGNYERALWLAIGEPNSHDRPDERVEKEILRQHWGNWETCKAQLPRSSRRSIVTYLVDHPTHFRNAFALVRVDLRSLYLAAYQSDLWNRILAAWIQGNCRSEVLRPVQLATATVPFYRTLNDNERVALAGLELPLPSARLHLDDGPLLTLYQQILAEQGLELRELRVKYPRDSFFSKGERSAVVVPEDWSCVPGPDDRYPGRQRATLQFRLARGAYATMLVKRLTELPSTAPADSRQTPPVT